MQINVPMNNLAFILQGEVVYANYGREKDFKILESLGMNLTNRIVLARYGMVFRANIVSWATLFPLAGER